MGEKYVLAVKTIKTAILQGQYAAAKGINRILLATYFAIGKYISQNSRQGFWGKGAIEAISEQLRKELPGLRGYAPTQMKNMRKFYEKWIILDPNSTLVSADLKSGDYLIDINQPMVIPNTQGFPIEAFFSVPFTHHIRILQGTATMEERFYYMYRCVEENLSADAVTKLIKQDAFHHDTCFPNNFIKTISDPAKARKAVMMFKDEYLLDFINVEEIGERDKNDIDERVVEKQIIENVKKFIMTFGKDFAFLGNQYHLEIYGENFIPDLLFFNRSLNALVVFELKTGDFKSIYLAQLMTYLRILDDKVRKPHENPSIGIVLCRNANKDFVKYVIQDYDKPMGVATFDTLSDMPERLQKALPDIEELKKLL